MTTVTQILSSPWTLVVWAALMLPCLAIAVRDLRTRNSHLASLMQVVWSLTILYSGPLGLALYWATGRKEIADDGLARRATRSVAHCYAGCGMGEVGGLLLAVGVLSLGTMAVVGITFAGAFTAGIALTVGPMMQGGVALREALRDAVIAETPSIAVMEAVAITVDIFLAGAAGVGDVRFWSSLVVSLTCGLLAAWPVNLLLIRYGVKSGMMDPRASANM